MATPDLPLRSPAAIDYGNRQVFSGEEYSEISVPISLLVKEDKLDIYPDVLGRNLFRIHLANKRLAFQAGGFLGIFPLNDSVALEVRPRVPLGNLERILLAVPEYLPEYLSGHLRPFAAGEIPTPSLMDLLAARLLQAVDLIVLEGLHYGYAERNYLGAMPRGRMLPFATVRHQLTTGRSMEVAFKTFERTHDIPINRCLRGAIHKLLQIYRGMKNRRGAREMGSRLARADQYFDNVRLDATMRFLADRMVYDTTALPDNKTAYRLAIPVARTILLNQGLLVRQPDGDMVLPAVMISMETLFESYIRSILQELRRRDQTLSVVNGNHAPPLGAERPLFDDTGTGDKLNRVAPDIVIWRGDAVGVAPELVLDTKYKPVNKPDRSDLDQVLVYGLVYRCKRVGLVYPRRTPTEPTVEHVGTVAAMRVYKFIFNLAADDLREEERAFVSATQDLMRPQQEPANATVP